MSPTSWRTARDRPGDRRSCVANFRHRHQLPVDGFDTAPGGKTLKTEGDAGPDLRLRRPEKVRDVTKVRDDPFGEFPPRPRDPGHPRSALRRCMAEPTPGLPLATAPTTPPRARGAASPLDHVAAGRVGLALSGRRELGRRRGEHPRRGPHAADERPRIVGPERSQRPPYDRAMRLSVDSKTGLWASPEPKHPAWWRHRDPMPASPRVFC